MKNGTRTRALAMLVAAGLVLSGADAGPQKVSVSDVLAGKAVLVGNLGVPLGTYVTIEGVRVEQPIKSANPLSIDTMDGKKLDTPVVLEIQGVKELPKGVRCVLRGYETGAMTSSPLDPTVEHRTVPQQNYHFAVWFEATQVKEPAGMERASNP